MSPSEMIGVGLREIPTRYRRLAYMLIAAAVVGACWPTVVGVLAAPAAIVELADRVEVMELRAVRDSARQERILCITEVQAGLRPQLDLQTRCAR